MRNAITKKNIQPTHQKPRCRKDLPSRVRARNPRARARALAPLARALASLAIYHAARSPDARIASEGGHVPFPPRAPPFLHAARSSGAAGGKAPRTPLDRSTPQSRFPRRGSRQGPANPLHYPPALPCSALIGWAPHKCRAPLFIGWRDAPQGVVPPHPPFRSAQQNWLLHRGCRGTQGDPLPYPLCIHQYCRAPL